MWVELNSPTMFKISSFRAPVEISVIKYNEGEERKRKKENLQEWILRTWGSGHNSLLNMFKKMITGKCLGDSSPLRKIPNSLLTEAINTFLQEQFLLLKRHGKCAKYSGVVVKVGRLIE